MDYTVYASLRATKVVAIFEVCNVPTKEQAEDYVKEVGAGHVPPLVQAAVEALKALHPGVTLTVSGYYR